MKKCSKTWYWITTASLFLVMLFNCGVGYYSISLFVTPITKSFSISSGDFAVLYIFYGLGSAIAAAQLHRLLKHVRLKKLIVFGGLISGVGYGIFAGAQQFSTLFAGGILIGASTVFAGTAAVQLVIAKWFYQKRSQITGAVAAASGIGTAIGSPVVGFIIREMGWKTACGVISVLVIVFVCVQVLFFLRDDPEQMGLLPFGMEVDSETEKGVSCAARETGIPIRDAWKKSYFWLFAGGMVVVSIVYQMISLYQSSILIEKGFSEQLAASCLSVFAVVDMCSKASAGVIADRFGFKVVTLYCAAGTVLAFVLVQVLDNVAGAVLFSALLGFWPTMCVLYGVTASVSLFGRKYLSEYIGFTQTVMCCCALVSMPAVKQMYNSVGNFNLIIAAAVGLVCIFFVMMIAMLRAQNIFAEKGS